MSSAIPRLITVVCCLTALAAALASQVHEVRAAGRWYPDTAANLNRILDQAFETAESRAGGTPPRKHLRALIAPHAGLQYSGVVAASAYRLAREPRNVIILAFSHRGGVEGVVAPSVEAFRTPLGDIAVDSAVVEDLGVPRLDGDPIADHSLENQLPFIHRVAPEATVTPLYVGRLSETRRKTFAARLAARIRQGDLVVASSDFTHYGEAYKYTPFRPDSKDLRNELYGLAMDSFEEIGAVRVAAFDDHLAGTGDTICGRDPVRLLLATLEALDEEVYLSLADYLTSGDLVGDFSTSVGYGALAFYPAKAFRVSAGDEQRLLASARATLDGLRSMRPNGPVGVPPDKRSAALKQRTGVFVTLKKEGKLRGCVGAIAPREALWELVSDRTVAASSADARFGPLTAKDGHVTLEVSLLTPLKRIRTWREFRPGFGAVITLNGKGGLLLPQLAGEFGWSTTEFLANLSRKAGLPEDAYKSPEARLYVYEAQVFSEPEVLEAHGVGPK